jgi:tol-pal system protein YbgF
MQKATTYLFYILLLPLIIQCASKEDVNSLDLRLRTLDNRQVNSERSVDEVRNSLNSYALNDSVDTVQKRLAKLDDKLERVNSDLMSVKGKSDENNYLTNMVEEKNKQINQKLNNQLRKLSSELDERAKNIDTNIQSQVEMILSRLAEMTEQISEITDNLSAVSTGLTEVKEARLKASAEAALAAAKEAELAKKKVEQHKGPRKIEPQRFKKKIKGAKKSKKKKGVKVKPIKVEDRKKTFLGKADSKFVKKEFRKSQQAYSDFLNQFPDSKYVVDARIGLARCHFELKEYDLTIMRVYEVLEEYPNHPKAPEAMMLQGLAFDKMEDTTTAKVLFKRVVNEYPDSDAAKSAKKMLKALGK